MTEQSTSSSDKDWGNLRFKPRRDRYADGSPEDNANSRFVIGLVVFVVVALLYPWYSYWVQMRLMARDLQQATEELGAQLKQEAEAANARTQREAARRQASATRQRIAGVRVLGAMITNGVPVVVVDMGEARLAESTRTICAQASARFGRSTAGMTLRVQSHRGRSPAVTIGSVHCR